MSYAKILRREMAAAELSTDGLINKMHGWDLKMIERIVDGHRQPSKVLGRMLLIECEAALKTIKMAMELLED